MEIEEVECVDTKAKKKSDILVGVVLKRCPVISYNKWTNILVYEKDGVLIQTNAIDYHGEGYVEVE